MKWIISNHKNALSEERLKDYLYEVNNLNIDNINLIICPKDEHLKYFVQNNYGLGSQDINLSIDELNRYNVKYSIIGHSYKRKKYHETNEQINEKIKKLISNNIIPILCIGEDETDNIKETLKQELIEGLKDIKGNIIIAYEPVWAIGSGMIPDNKNLKEIIEFIDIEATKILGSKSPILYGGSVNEDTIEKLEQIKKLDGYLIGQASLDIKKVKKIIEVVK